MNHFLTLELHLPYKSGVPYSAHVCKPKKAHGIAAIMIQAQGSGATATTQLQFSVPGKISSKVLILQVNLFVVENLKTTRSL